MVRRRVVPLAAAVSLGFAACADQTPITPAALTPDPAASFSLRPGQPGQYLVGFSGPAEIAPEVLAASGGQVVEALPRYNVLVVDGVTNPDALKAANPLYIEAAFEVSIDPYREQDLQATTGAPVEAAAVPGQQDVPWFASGVQWDMKVMKADAGWLLTDGGEGVRVCVIDTGVDPNHQELRGKVVAAASFLPGNPVTDDENGHGSHVAGTVAAKGVVISGVAPRASIMSARVFGASGGAAVSWIINGIDWCTDNGAHVINMSLGGLRYRGTPNYVNDPITYGASIKRANDAGVVVITSAGNSNLNVSNTAIISVPAQVPGAINVGATGPLSKSTAPAAPNWNPFDPSQVWRGVDNKAYYSNFGKGVQVFAPGGRGGIPLSEKYRFADGIAQGSVHDNIWSVCSSQTAQSGAENTGGVPGAFGTCLGNDFRYVPYAGTSMAAPHVSGMAAVLYDELGGTRSAANRMRVEKCILNTADKIGSRTIYTNGRVNVRTAIRALRAGNC